MSARDPKSPRGWRWTGYVKSLRCDRCGGSHLLVVHHKDRDNTNNADLENLETLCRICHRKEHAEEITTSQRLKEVNERRGAAISKARTGKHYPKDSATMRARWAGPDGDKMREVCRSDECRRNHSAAAKRLWQDPNYVAARKAAKEARRGEK